MMQQENAKDAVMFPLDCPFTSILGQLSAKQDPSSRQALGWRLKVGVLYLLPQSNGVGVRGPVWRRPPARLQKGPRPRLLLTPAPPVPPPLSTRLKGPGHCLPEWASTSGPSACQWLLPEDSTEEVKERRNSRRKRGRGCRRSPHRDERKSPDVAR